MKHTLALVLMVFGSLGVNAQTYSLSLKYLCDSEAWWLSNGYALTKDKLFYHESDTNKHIALDCSVAKGEKFLTYICGDGNKKINFKFNKDDLTFSSKFGMHAAEEGQCLKPTLTQRLQSIEQLVKQ